MPGQIWAKERLLQILEKYLRKICTGRYLTVVRSCPVLKRQYLHSSPPCFLPKLFLVNVNFLSKAYVFPCGRHLEKNISPVHRLADRFQSGRFHFSCICCMRFPYGEVWSFQRWKIPARVFCSGRMPIPLVIWVIFLFLLLSHSNVYTFSFLWTRGFFKLQC